MIEHTMFGNTNTPEAVERNRDTLVEAQKQTLEKLHEEGEGRGDGTPLATAYDFIEQGANADHANEQKKYVNHALDKLNQYASHTGDYTGINEIVELLKEV